ncbi:Glutaredoxin-C1 [Raphanus sativus]|uniref:Glutaredoxin-C1 n=1 Tax=Raphanus sativus TaxID=3726 RepID=A0A6J0LBY7_RAPSA|nr:glutaredoxin-C1 [Raphanus sativus]KAJ4878535.1 Glutaredoxin-C1 [Raphanus sativus]
MKLHLPPVKESKCQRNLFGQKVNGPDLTRFNLLSRLELRKRMSKEKLEKAMNKAKEIVSSYPVVVFSKTYCGYCQKVKQLLTKLGADFEVLELDEMSDGGEIQSALSKWTGQRTVPNVFIKGKHIGGCDSVMESNQKGTLVPLLVEAGVLTKISSKL